MSKKSQLSLELTLVMITLGITTLLHEMAGQKMVVLNLFFLPVVLAGFYLGRYRAGVLALFCVISASVVTGLDMGGFAAFNDPLLMGFAVIVWGAVLGMTALLVGSLSDERTAKIAELHEAHVGVVEVFSKYLQSANPRMKARSIRVAELSQRVARRMNCTANETDDIRVAALLQDMASIEITAKVIHTAVDNLESEPISLRQHTFGGDDLLQSLGSVLSGAMPLLNQIDETRTIPMAESDNSYNGVAIGARIIRAVRAYDVLLRGEWDDDDGQPLEVMDTLRCDIDSGYDSAVLDALQSVVAQTASLREIAEQATC